MVNGLRNNALSAMQARKIVKQNQRLKLEAQFLGNLLNNYLLLIKDLPEMLPICYL
jgi:hypothetical protein